MARGMSVLVSAALWSRLKYLNNYFMDGHYIFCRYSLSTEDESLWLWWSSDFSFSATIRLAFLVCRFFLILLINQQHTVDVKEKLRSDTTHFRYLKKIRETLMTYTEAFNEPSIEETIKQAVQFKHNVLQFKHNVLLSKLSEVPVFNKVNLNSSWRRYLKQRYCMRRKHRY